MARTHRRTRGFSASAFPDRQVNKENKVLLGEPQALKLSKGEVKTDRLFSVS